MPKIHWPRGAFLNAVSVLVGSTAGLGMGQGMNSNVQAAALTGIGLVTLALGVKMFLETRNVLIVAGAIALGGVIGQVLGFDAGLDRLADSMRSVVGGGERFNQGLVTATVLFCIGPMTLLGCVQDGLEGKLELLALKSLLDGISSAFLAAASPSFGQGVLASTLVVLLVQSCLTLAARPLSGMTKQPRILAETTAAGGPILVGIALGLLEIKSIRAEIFLPALGLAPAFAALGERIRRAQPEKNG